MVQIAKVLIDQLLVEAVLVDTLVQVAQPAELLLPMVQLVLEALEAEVPRFSMQQHNQLLLLVLDMVVAVESEYSVQLRLALEVFEAVCF